MKPDIQGILLIVIDCLRADRVSAAGYHCRTTPTIDRLATDPTEQTNLGDRPDRAATRDQMECALDTWWNACRPSSLVGAGEVEIDERTVQRLRDLGYLD